MKIVMLFGSEGTVLPLVFCSTIVAFATPAPTLSPLRRERRGGSSTSMMLTYAALALALLAFLLYLIPRGQTSLAVKLLSLVLPSSLARRFGAGR